MLLMFSEGRSHHSHIQLDSLIHFLLSSMPQDITHNEIAEQCFLNLFEPEDGEENNELIYA